MDLLEEFYRTKKLTIAPASSVAAEEKRKFTHQNSKWELFN